MCNELNTIDQQIKKCAPNILYINLLAKASGSFTPFYRTFRSDINYNIRSCNNSLNDFINDLDDCDELEIGNYSIKMLNHLYTHEEYELLSIPTGIDAINPLSQIWYNNKDYDLINYLNQMSTNSRKRQSLVFVTLNQPIFHITTGVLDQTQIWVSKTGLNDLFLCNGTCDIVVPDSYFINSEPVGLFIYLNGTLLFSQSYDVITFSSCPIPTSPFSPVWSQTWNCATVLGRFVLVCAIIGILVLCVIIVILIVALAYYVYNSSFCMSAQASVQNTINMNSNNNDENAPSIMPNWAKQLLNSRRIQNEMLIVLLFLPLVLAVPHCNNITAPDLPIKSCQYSFSLSSQELVCTGNSCILDYNYLITFQLLGQTVCLNFYNTNNDIILIMQLTYAQSIRLVSMEYLYITSDWDFVGLSDKSCPSTSACPLSGCPLSNTVAFNNRFSNAFPQVNLTQFPTAIKSCTASCGCAGCGCFFCNSGCMWQMYDYVPKLNKYGVYSPLFHYTYPVMIGMYYKPLDNCYISSIDLNFKSQTFSGFPIAVPTSQSIGNNSLIETNVVIISDITLSTVDFGVSGLICSYQNQSDNNCYWGPVSPVNGPISGLVGDIQLYNDQSFIENNKSAWNPDSVIRNQLDSSIDFITPQSGIRVLSGYLKFNPTAQIGSVVWNVALFGLQGLDTNPGPLTLGLNTISPFNVSFSTVSVCPLFTILNSSGCYGCALGATIDIQAKSTCTGGVVQVSISGPALIGTGTIDLSTSFETYTITIFPDVPTPNLILTLSYKSNSLSVPFNPFYQSFTKLSNGSWISTPGNTSGIISSTDFSDWWWNLSGVWSWLKWFFAICIGIAFLIGLGGIIGVSVYLIYTSKYKLV